MTYWLVRRFMAFVFGKLLKQQCSGKIKEGHAFVWCQKRVGHADVCISYDNVEFKR